jgi:hypothetical protein
MRAITNLLGHPVNYGQRAHAAIANAGKAIEIAIDDDGLGGGLRACIKLPV